MKPILALLLSTLTLIAAQRPEDVTAIWVGGSIQVSWLAPAEPPDIVHIQRRLDGRKDETWDVVSSKLGTMPGLPGQERNFVQDERVYLAPGEYSYRIAFGGKGGPWSRFAIEQNRPVGEAVAAEPPPPSATILTRREGRTDFEKMQIASARAITPLPLRAERAPFPPETPAMVSVSATHGGVLVKWRINGIAPEGEAFPVNQFDVLRIYGVANTEQLTRTSAATDYKRVTHIAADNQTTYEWLDLEGLVGVTGPLSYRVRAISKATGDVSPWSEAMMLAVPASLP